MVYAVINSETNIVENVTIWDGSTEWTPPDGCFTQPVDGANIGIGWSFIDGEWIAPTPEPEI